MKPTPYARLKDRLYFQVKTMDYRGADLTRKAMKELRKAQKAHG